MIEHSGAVEYVDPVPSGDTRSPVTGQDPRGSGAGDSAPTVWDAFEVLDQAIGSSSPVDMNPLDFEGKYAGATDAQILIAHTAAQSKLERERAKITEGLMAQGRFIESIVREGDPSPFPQATKENPIVSFGFEIEHGNGFQKVRLTEIDANEFPEFHALESEYYWLGSKVSKMKKEQ